MISPDEAAAVAILAMLSVPVAGCMVAAGYMREGTAFCVGVVSVLTFGVCRAFM